MKRRVVITGTGLITPLGDRASDLHTALCEGKSALNQVERFDTSQMEGCLAGELTSFKPQPYLGKRNFRPLDRTSQLSTAAVQLVLDACGDTSVLREQQDVGLVVGTMFCSVHTIAEFDRRGVTEGPGFVKPLDFANTVINAAAGQTAIWHDLRGVNSTIATGGSSGLHALAYGADMIRSGRSRAILAGGVEELCFESMFGYYQAECLAGSKNNGEPHPVPFDVSRNGFALSEGAAFLMLEDAELAEARGVTPLAEILGQGKAYDYSRGQNRETSVQAVSLAIQNALREAAITAGQIDCISAAANGSVSWDRNETIALANVFEDAIENIAVTAIKSMLGDTLGAAGAIQTVALIEAMQTGKLPGIPALRETEPDFPLQIANPNHQNEDWHLGLINAISTDGNCCSLIIKC